MCTCNALHIDDKTFNIISNALFYDPAVNATLLVNGLYSIVLVKGFAVHAQPSLVSLERRIDAASMRYVRQRSELFIYIYIDAH